MLDDKIDKVEVKCKKTADGQLNFEIKIHLQIAQHCYRKQIIGKSENPYGRFKKCPKF